jgi:GNAT superfamily N-acetyltransferase
MIIFKELNKDSWKKYEKYILNSENIFPENIRTPEEEFPFILSHENAFGRVAFLKDEYIGYVIGYPLDETEYLEHEIPTTDYDKNIIYLFSIVIDSNFQGKGYGYLMLLDYLEESKRRRFDLVYGHFRPNSSYYIFKKAGGEEVSIHKNWYDTFEDYSLCRIDLEIFNYDELVKKYKIKR